MEEAMKVLLVGGGGREHALAWKIRQSPLVDKLYCAPGNGGIASLAQCVPIKAMDIDGMVNFARNEKIDLVMLRLTIRWEREWWTLSKKRE
jgi:phosphoribosylamine--glycine ligase